MRPLFDRFLEKIVAGPDGCWRWMGAKQDLLGYGVIWNGAKVERAHRVAYKLFIGELPDSLTIDHLCRHPWCVNPTHLEAVTKKENTLRGESLAAQHARQTHCVNGHAFTPENTYLYSCPEQSLMRCCRECRRLRSAEFRKRQVA